MSQPSINQLDPSISKWIKLVLVLLLGRVSKPLQWSSFLSLNPLIRKIVSRNYKYTSYNDEESKRHVSSITNAVTCVFLYLATANNTRVPKDYISIYVWINYIANLNPPSALKIIVSRLSRFTKVDNYNSKLLKKIYENKEYIFYPLIFAQILSNYLTPTRYKLNQRYMSSSIKTMILNPIWINYSLGVRSHRMNWLGLTKIYLQHNVVLGLVIGLGTFKSRFLDHYYELKHGVFLNGDHETTVSDIVKNYLAYIVHRANSFANFIYLPNLLAILLISLTSPFLTHLRKPTNSAIHRWYLSHMKLFFKSYTKVIGFVVGLITIFVNSSDFIPDFGYVNEKSDDTSESRNIRRISKSSINGISSYLFNLILLSKWRVTKENHPQFKLLKLRSWNKFEALLMCIGIFKVMNLNDFIKKNVHGENNKECERLKNETLVKLVSKVM